jgi:UDP-N-acetylmuramoyl-tripeptide--D-alanyl-D-alanine ligase
MIILDFISHILFILALGYYLITNLQWYSYKIDRVIIHHTKVWWHLVYFLIPLGVYLSAGSYGFIVVFLYLALLFQWYQSLDKKLVFTGRIKRFFTILIFLALFEDILCVIISSCANLGIIVPIFIALVVSFSLEAILFEGFKKSAEKKLKNHKDMTVIGITASYGKTSIKNFITHILGNNFKTYCTPRSVNTLGGVMKDINDDLPSDTEVYVVEMGARGVGDIAEITLLVNPHYTIVGKIGVAHLEYFGSLENIRNTKMEIIQSNRLKEGWVHNSALINPSDTIHKFGDEITDIDSSLNGLRFKLDGVEYSTKLLGSFHTINLVASIKVALAMGMKPEDIQKRIATIEPVAHRLQRIDAGGKVILDDSFNGNIDGMMASFELAKTYDGRKVLITPGLVEVDDMFNEEVAKRANEIFDLIVITGDLNYHIFKALIDENKLLKLQSKDKMQEMLVENTEIGDLILFANDAPSFI